MASATNLLGDLGLSLLLCYQDLADREECLHLTAFHSFQDNGPVLQNDIIEPIASLKVKFFPDPFGKGDRVAFCNEDRTFFHGLFSF